MILKFIRLRNFKGFLSGMGLSEVAIDLTSLPDGLVAVTGANGAGKTTLLDNLHPYRLQPFKIRRAKEWSPAAFSFYDQCFGSDAMKELIFEMDGITYKSLILIDAERRKQEAYLYRSHPEYNNDERPSGWFALNDGKSKTYDEAVEKVCGSPSLFFSSVFRCQGAKNLSDYSRGDIMSVIAELLNIDHIKAQSEKCRIVVNGLSAGLTSVRSRLADIDSEQDVVTDLQHKIAELDADIAGNHLLLADSRKDLVAVQAEVAGMKERKAAAESERVRLDMLKSQLSGEQKRLQDTTVSMQNVLADFDRRIASARSDYSRFKSDLETKVARAEKIASGGEQIRQAVEAEALLVAQIEPANAELNRLRFERDALKDDAAVYIKQLHGVQTDIRNAVSVVARLDGLDCRGDASGWLNPNCKLISAAVEQRDALDGWKSLAADLERRVAEDNVALEAYSVQITAAIDNCDALSAKLEECRKFTRLLPELELAESSLTEWRQQLVDREKSVESDIKTLEGERWYADSECLLATSKINDSIRELEKQIATFPALWCDEELLRNKLIREGALLSTIELYEKRIREYELAASGIKAKLEVSRSRLDAGDDLRAQAARYESEIAKFSLLMKACSNDGIVALELDDSLPSIAAIVNDLLRSCYGSRFTIRMDTQSAKVDGSMKEDFDIIVYDSETGDERSVTEMSGGQNSYINDALTRGICLYNIQSRGKTYGTLFADEVDGALDAGRKLEFLNIKREALRIGSHSRELFISQSPELIELADARIVLEKGRVYVC